MNYQLKTTSNANRLRRNFFYIATAGFIIVLLVFSTALRSSLSPIAGKILEPVFSAAFFIKDKTVFLFDFIRPKGSLIKENEELKKTLELQKIKLLDYERLKDENEELLGLQKSQTTQNFVTARVIRVPDSSPYDTVIVDAGEEDGVASGDFISGLSGVPIGKIEYVYHSFSRAKLFSSPGETHEVRIGKEKITAKAVGQGGGNFEALLPRGALISIGDAVMLSDISGSVFGFVEHIIETEGGTFMRVLFKNPVSFFNLSFVTITKGKSI